MAIGKFDAVDKTGGPGRGWPPWARAVATGALLVHAAAVWAGAWGKPPASDLQRSLDSAFSPYHEITRLGQSYGYYIDGAPPTPVISATLSFGDGRPEEVVRIPERGTWPRLRYQRQLALAHALMMDFEEARHVAGDGSRSRWAHAFAAHLGRAHPGCKEVTLRLRMHRAPDPARVRALLARPGAGPIDLDADEFSSAPERIGVYPCDAS